MKLFGRDKGSSGEILSGGESAIANKEVEGLSQGQIVRRRFFRHRGAVIALFVLTSLIVFVMSALDTKIGALRIPGWWKWTVEDIPELRYEDCPGGTTGCPTLSLNPSGAFGLGTHPFGQDDIGRDYFALVMNGARRSLMIMFVIGAVSGFIGVVVGSIAGFYGKRVDAVLMRLVDFIQTVPGIIIAAVIGKAAGRVGPLFLALFLGLLGWTGLARLVRAQFLSLREMEFVDAARVAGASNVRITFKHILPNAIGQIIVVITLIMAGAILTETALSYLGFGVVAPDVSLGLLISQYESAFTTRPFLFWWPGFFIISIALCVNFIGDGLRDAFDPRQKRRITKKDRLKAKVDIKAGR
ncbi:MAG: ABC transporter permease [Candidatus Planktophila sp.]|jgi:peptide/nickel transport system permease protein|nr:ABC transporter permease [Candidatus Planktophila sp.]